jgi:hypothetical protein
MSHILDGRTVLDPDGREVRLGQLWRDRAAVVVFIRHFGCLFCRQQVAEIVPLADEVRSLGGELYVVGHGTLEQTRAFRDEQSTPFPLFTDPTRQAYELMGMRRGLRTVLAPGVLWRSLQARRAGFRQSRVAGDPLQQGGVLVLAAGGRELYRFISREAGHHAPPADVLAALKAAPRV